MAMFDPKECETIVNIANTDKLDDSQKADYQEQITNLQLALCEVFEMLTSGGKS